MKSACLKLISKFDDRDSDLVFSAIDDYQTIGLPPEKAQVAAVRDALRVLQAERDEYLSSSATEARYNEERTNELDKASAYADENGIFPYVSEGPQAIPVDIQKSVKREGKYGDHPILGIPVNANGTVTLYYPTTNEDARRIVRERTLKGVGERVYLTNESSVANVMAAPGNIAQEIDGASVLLQINPDFLQIDSEHEGGRKDFFVQITEGSEFRKKMSQVRLFTQNAPRTKGLSKSTTISDITGSITSAVEEMAGLDFAGRRARVKEARLALKAKHNVGTLLGVNGKLEKTNVGGYGLDYDGKDVMSMGLALASAQKINDEQKATTCPRSAICEMLCLGETSGQNQLYGGEGQYRSGPRMSQYLKTEAMVQSPEDFATILYFEIDRFARAAKRGDYQATVRLNVTSDFAPKVFEALIKAFPDVMFYDYTKLNTKPISENHHLTYSSTGASQIVDGKTIVNPESNWDAMLAKLNRGFNVAMAFTDKNEMPSYVVDEKTGQRFQVWNGDNYDARFLDPKSNDGIGMIVGLTNKDRTTKPEDAAAKHNGFFIDYDPKRDGNTVVIKDQEKLESGKNVIRIRPAMFSRSRQYGVTVGIKPGTQFLQAERDSHELTASNELNNSGSDVLFSRGRPGGSLGIPQIEAMAERVMKDWANPPSVIVATDMSDPVIPEAAVKEDAQQLSNGAEGTPSAFYHKGTVYIIASQMRSNADVADAMFHEALGHYGMRRLFGLKFTDILNDISDVRRQEAINMARKYGLTSANVKTASDQEIWAQMSPEQRLKASEEVLAFMAQETPELSFVKRAIAVIRTWLRNHIPMLAGMYVTDDQIINGVIIPARKFVKQGLEAAKYARDTDIHFQRSSDYFDGRSSWTESRIESLLSSYAYKTDPRKTKAFAAWVKPYEFVTATTPKSEVEQLKSEVYQLDTDMLLNERQPIFLEVQEDGAEGEYRIVGHEGRHRMLAMADYGIGSVPVVIVNRDGPIDDAQIVENPYFAPQKFSDGSRAQRGFEAVYMEPISYGNRDEIIESFGSERADVRFSRSRSNTDDFIAPYTSDTITIDGVERSALNSEGRSIAETEEQLRNFWRWFGDSKVVDANGKPLSVYHASLEDFNEFKPQSWGDAGDHSYFYFAASKQWSKRFAKEEMSSDKPVLRSFYLSIKNPLDLTDTFNKTGKDWLKYFAELGVEPKDNLKGKLEAAPARQVIPAWQLLRFDTPLLGGIREQLLAKGYDGLILRDVDRGRSDNTTYVAFEPTQIKSATGNQGTFDPSNPDIRKSASRPWFEDAAKLKVTSTYQLGDLLDTSKKLTWWDKSVGTMYHVAQRNPEFKRAYDAIQGFIGDISTYANRSADMAPTILPKLEDWKDIAAKPLSAEDVRALRDPVFGGTLNYSRDKNGEIQDEQDVQKAGVVFTDQELRSIFGLNERQIGLYHEVRNAIDQSITDLAISDMIRYLGKDGIGIEQDAMESGDVVAAADIIKSHLEEMADNQPERASVLRSTIGAVQGKANKARNLMAKGYAPLSRFGQYTVYAVDQNGEQLYFSMFENERDANVMAREMREQYPQATVTTRVMSQESYKLFSGITPETLELFGESLGLEQSGLDAKDEAFQQYLKLAKTSRSAMKRLIHRKGIDGFSEDAGRVLAGFVVSNARQVSTNLHASEIAQSVSSIKDGDVKDAAIRMMEHVQNPREEAQALRGLMFANFIGGSIASAAVNMTQPFTMTLPYLSQFDGAMGAGRRMVDAVKLASRGITDDDDLKTALKQAEDDGVVSPQEIFQLMGQAQGKSGLMSGDGTKIGDARAKVNNALTKLSLAWGKVFSAAEQFNRRVTFVAAYKLARDKGMADPFAFAEKAVNETQGVFNKGNKPQWARGAVGATLFTFKQYSIAYVEFLQRMWGNGPEGKKAVGLALLVLFMVSGLGGLPGADDLDDVIDGIMQRVFGKSFNSKQQKKEFLASLLGDSGADFVMSGISGLPGAPIDVSGRMGLGNLIPGTGVLTKKQSYQRDVTEIFGPAGTMVSNWASAAGSLAQGDVAKAATSVSPLAVQNVLKAIDMATMGEYRDGAGRKIINTNGWEAAVKAIGFQPSSVKRIQDATSIQQNLVVQNRIRESEIVDMMVRGRVERKPDLLDDARRQLVEWNAENPDSPIKINQNQINRRVQQANMDKAKRLAAAAPREIRQSVAKELELVRQ